MTDEETTSNEEQGAVDAPPAPTNATPSEDTGVTGPSIRLVVQRYRQANVLIDESKVVTVGNVTTSSSSSLMTSLRLGNMGNKDDASSSVGLLAYLSFAKTANPQLIEQAAKTLLHLPVLTLGGWGDGSTARSILQLATATSASEIKTTNEDSTPTASSLSVVLIPQASLISKVKRNGKSIQYHDQIEKSEGENLYNLFVDTVRNLLLEHQCKCRTGKSAPPKKKPTTPDPSIPPNQLFRQFYNNADSEDGGTMYATFDDDGFPLTTKKDNAPLTKSARKKLQKIYDAHVKRHEKYVKEGGKPMTTWKETSSAKQEGEEKEVLDDKFVHLVAGSFGKRQGLELFSDMGLFCHVVEI